MWYLHSLEHINTLFQLLEMVGYSLSCGISSGSMSLGMGFDGLRCLPFPVCSSGFFCFLFIYLLLLLLWIKMLALNTFMPSCCHIYPYPWQWWVLTLLPYVATMAVMGFHPSSIRASGTFFLIKIAIIVVFNIAIGSYINMNGISSKTTNLSISMTVFNYVAFQGRHSNKCTFCRFSQCQFSDNL